VLDPIEPYCARWPQQVRRKFRYSHAAQHDISMARVFYFVGAWEEFLRLARHMRSLFRMHGSDALCSDIIFNCN